jgi:hypothetical protein
MEMNPYFNPFGVLSNLGPSQMPRYTATGRYIPSYGGFSQHPGTRSWDGWCRQNMVRGIPTYPEAKAYSELEMTGMRQQLEGDGLGGAFAWSMSMMTPAEWEAELRRYS